MPTFKTGNMFKVPGLKIVTTNSFLTKDRRLVMGRGAAWTLLTRIPDIDRIFGRMVFDTCGHLGTYGLLMYGKYGAAQIKHHFRNKADLDLIAFSMAFLADEAKAKSYIYHINYPGIGNGGLDKDIVRPILDILPDNVYVWEKAEHQDDTNNH
jgi:hypothetical protein